MAWIEIDGKEIPLLEPPETQKASPRRLLQVVFKYRRLIRNIFLSISLPLILVVFVLPQKYLATSKVFIKPSRAYLNLSPTSQESALSVAPSTEVLNSEMQIIKSREVLGQLKKELPFPDNGWLDSGSPFAIEATPVKATSIIEISLASTNDQWAAKVVNRAVELYQEEQIKVRKTQGIEKFYDEQDRRLRTDLLTAEEALKAFQQREGIVDAGQEVNSSLSALVVAEKSLKDTESSIRETEKRVTMLETQLKGQQPTVSSSKSITTDPVYSSIRTRLTQLELERQSLLQRYLPKDRLVLDKEREIAELKKQLDQAAKTTVGSESIGLNAVYQRILNELLSARVQLQGLREKRDSDANQVASYGATAADKKKKSFEFDRLQQVVAAKRDAVALYKKRAEEARISDAMDEQKFGNAFVLEKAALPLPLAGRSTILWLLVITFFAAAVSIGFAFVMNYFDPSVQDEISMEQEFGVPVLATIQHYGT
jgi:succinoglycan biosynthesis transport protein ExoP